jgi:predicted HAD superfamily phosphohydrolase
MEYNHMEELGFTEDKQLVCNASGFLDRGMSLRRVSDRFIRNGGRLYDVLSACDTIVPYMPDGEVSKKNGTLRALAAFLKAYGVTDGSLREFFINDTVAMPGADSIHYLDGLMTVTVLSETYEHHISVLCDLVGISSGRVRCTEAPFDWTEFEENDAKWLREVAEEISKMDIPKITVSDDEVRMEQKDKMIVETVAHLTRRISKKVFGKRIEPMGADEKFHTLQSAVRMTGVNLPYTAYIGTDATDYLALDVVRSNEGLAISFNGDSHAVKGANVAVMSPNSIAAAVLVTEFYANGIESVYSMIGSWDRKKLMNADFYDHNLMNAMLSAFPSKLPKVVIVDDDNMNDVMKESEKYRRKLSY